MIAREWAVGIDLGATKAGIAQVDSLGNLHHKIVVPTGTKKSAEEVIDDIANAVRTIKESQSTPPIGIGIGVAGQVIPEEGLIVHSPNLQWNKVPIGNLLTKSLHLSVAICNDVHAATRGEWLHGAGQKSQDIVCVFVGTGIGGGIVSGGNFLKGSSHTIAEIGHMTVNMNGRKCACGNIGCLEAYAGGASLGNRLREAIAHNPEEGKHILQLANLNIEEVSAKTLQKAVEKRIPLAEAIMNEATQALIAGSISIVHALNPHHLIFGGGVIEGMPHLVGIIENGIRKSALKAATERLEVMHGKLHNDAGIIGAAALAIEKFAH